MVNKSESMKTLKNARKCLRQCGHPRDDLELIAAKVPILRFHRDGVQVSFMNRDSSVVSVKKSFFYSRKLAQR